MDDHLKCEFKSNHRYDNIAAHGKDLNKSKHILHKKRNNIDASACFVFPLL